MTYKKKQRIFLPYPTNYGSTSKPNPGMLMLFEKILIASGELPDEDGVYIIYETQINHVSATFNASTGIFISIDGNMVLEPIYWLKRIM